MAERLFIHTWTHLPHHSPNFNTSLGRPRLGRQYGYGNQRFGGMPAPRPQPDTYYHNIQCNTVHQMTPIISNNYPSWKIYVSTIKNNRMPHSDVKQRQRGSNSANGNRKRNRQQDYRTKLEGQGEAWAKVHSDWT